ncbi:trehalose-phosphatase [Lujinxingia sediminis]|uniref:Trehalose 6-phosphate phosphatase n=1 Tax=Lujinxingia sediminis TaxID=2480984 RepID=A0ABY0CTS0_9DELT|nr:trehalose-phosphatase [Lujinxingia sediminis]RVU44853.1 trehalose-phosphatase [Lujinxingia sediminis]
MKTLDDVVDAAAEALAGGRRLLVMLDYDGTLAPIAPRPELAIPAPGATRAIDALVQAGGQVVIVSGRGAADVHARLGVDSVDVVGSHGLELWWASGARELVEGAEEARETIAKVEAAWRTLASARPGAVVEQKPFGVALHYRLVERGGEALATRASEIALAQADVRIKSGKCVVEAVPALRWDKGSAARLVLRRAEASAEAGVHAIYVGDDLTDEDAFVALRDRASTVLVAPDDRASEASARVADPAQVVRLIWELAALCDRDQGRLAGLP